MTDPRPKPQYGEYAPIDPSRIIPPQHERADPVTLAAESVATRSDGAGPSGAGTDGAGSSGAEAKLAPRKTWDVALTTVLLLFGVYSVATSFGEIGSLGAVLSQLFEAQGIGKFTAYELAAQVGIAMNVLQAVLLVITIVISLLLISRRKLSFYVPVAGAVLTSIVFTVCIAIVMFGDPAFGAYLGQ